MRLNIETWQPFVLSRLFDIKKGKRLTSEDQTEGHYIYIGAIDSNNGVAAHIGQEPIHEGNTISLSYNGSVGEAFYQAEPFWATDDVNVLYPRFEGFDRDIGLFISTVLRLEKIRFSYGRKWTLENMQNTVIKLPVLIDSSASYIIDDSHLLSDEGYIPDWQFMEDYIKSLHYKPITTVNNLANISLQGQTWKEFALTSLFEVSVGKYYYPEQYSQGQVPYITASDTDNGIGAMVDLSPDFTGGKISIGKIGATAYYQSQDFCATSDVNILTPKSKMNKYHLLFITSIINYSENYKWSYGRQCRKGDTESMVIKLPVKCNSHGNPEIDDNKQFSDYGYIPDWNFMEDYIKNLPYGDRI